MSTKNLNYRIKSKIMDIKIAIWYYFYPFNFMFFSYTLAQLNLQSKARKLVVLGTQLH